MTSVAISRNLEPLRTRRKTKSARSSSREITEGLLLLGVVMEVLPFDIDPLELLASTSDQSLGEPFVEY